MISPILCEIKEYFVEVKFMFRIAICDDDRKYVDYLERMIEKVSDSSEKYVVYKYFSGEEFLENLNLEFDLVILDMQMGKIDGITAALNFRKCDQEAVLVFCTGVQLPKPEFFDVQPFRYLMKSYKEEKLCYEVKIIIERMIDNRKESFIVVCNDGEMSKISISDISYISNLKRGSCIHIFSRKNNQCYEMVSNKKLLEIYEELKNQYFEYAHNSYIVNFRSIIGIKKDVITLEDLTSLNISRSKKATFHNKFTEYLGLKYKRNR